MVKSLYSNKESIMNSLNLINCPIEDIKKFILECRGDNKEIEFESGEYGMVLLHRVVQEESLPYIGNSSILKISSMTLNHEPIQYVKYVILDEDFNNVSLTIFHKKELDIREGQEIHEQTGYPIKSSTLYLKEKI